jgi:hypothetical protein
MLGELLEYLYPHLKEFALHNYVSWWQDLQFKECLKNLPPETILTCVDFSKNYTMKIQNKIQNVGAVMLLKPTSSVTTV